MESWRKVWREGFAPQLPSRGLECLQMALRENDERIIQGATTAPPPLQCMMDNSIEGCCVLGFCFLQGDNRQTVAEVEEDFARLCFETDQKLGDPGACRWFLNWYDETPRQQMREELLGEVELELARRQPVQPVPSAMPVEVMGPFVAA